MMPGGMIFYEGTRDIEFVLVGLKDPDNRIQIEYSEAVRVGLVTESKDKSGTLRVATHPPWKLSLNCPAAGKRYRILAIDKNPNPRDQGGSKEKADTK